MLINSILTQIIVAITTFILCFLSKYFYTKAKNVGETNIVIRATRANHIIRKKMELYTVIFSLLGITLFSYFIYLSILNATLGGSWIWAYIKIMLIFTVIMFSLKNGWVSSGYVISIPGMVIMLYLLYFNQHIFKDIIIKISEKPIFMHMDVWIIVYVLFFFTIYFFNLSQKRNNIKKKSFKVLTVIFGTIVIISSIYFYYLMIKSAVEGRSHIATLGQMIIFPIIGVEMYLYKKDKLFNIDYQFVTAISSVGINLLIFAVSLIIYYIVQGKISVQVIRVS